MKKTETQKRLNDFIIQLPFDYKKAVLTQARTSSHRPYAFIVEFDDGSRQFMKGPFDNVESVRGHVVCNEIKRKLASRYLHPIQCGIKEYGENLVFLECEELGKADLSKVSYKQTKLERGTFAVLDYDSNDVVPDPFIFLEGVNRRNAGIWVGLIVNYCYRWVFGIGDTARRNLMLQRSTGKIYSVDETGVEKVYHDNVWGGKKPDKKTFELVKAFTESKRLGEVLKEVKRWKGVLPGIRSEVVPLSDAVADKIDNLIKYPEIVLDTQLTN